MENQRTTEGDANVHKSERKYARAASMKHNKNIKTQANIEREDSAKFQKKRKAVKRHNVGIQ